MTVSVADGVTALEWGINIFRDATAPTAGNIGDLWIDLSGSPPVLYVCSDDSPIIWSPIVGGGGGGTTITEYANFAALPGTATAGDLALVLAAQGVPFINRKEAGIYRWSGTAWDYIDAIPENYFVDDVMKMRDDADPTKMVAFQLSSVATGTTRTLIIPNADGQLALAATTLAGYGITDAAPLTHVGTGGTEHPTAVPAGAAGFMSGADKTKLDGVAVGATANSSDATLLNRANHTGTQTIATVSGLQTALDNKLDDSQASAYGLNLLDDVDATAARTTLGLGTAATTASTDYTPASHIGTGGTQHADVVAAGASGFMTGADKTKLNGIATGATANSSDATLLSRANHTGTQTASTISDFSEAVDDRVGALLVAGTNVTLTYNDGANSLTIDATGGGGGGTLDSLTDVVITAATTGQVLKFDGANWINDTDNTSAGGGLSYANIWGIHALGVI